MLQLRTGQRRPQLFHFLQGALNGDKRELHRLSRLYARPSVAFYLHSSGGCFQHDQRARILCLHTGEELASAVVFFDPKAA